jgi:hypothetical protein
MSIRSVRLCDIEAEGKQCPKPADTTCPLCERDCCSEHWGEGWIGTSVLIWRMGQGVKSLGIRRLRVCTACTNVLQIPDRPLPTNENKDGPARPAFDSIIQSAFDELPTAAKAYMAEQKLKATK